MDENIFGKRLARARQSAGLSLRALAKEIGVTAPAIQKYEKGISFPSSDVLSLLSNALGISVESLFRSQNITLKEFKFRKKSALGIKKLHAIEHNIRDQLERRLELENSYPQIPVKPLKENQFFEIIIQSLDDIEGIALKMREKWKLGNAPIHDLTDVLENHGIRVIAVDTDESGFDGLFFFHDEDPIVVINKNWPGDRQRFSLAHELGHFILHKKLSPLVDEEKACNRFAGAFLFPSLSVIEEFGKNRSAIEWEEIFLAKHEYGLSMAAVCYRLKDNQIITEKIFKNLWVFFSSNGWRKREPDPQLPPEKAHVFEQMLFHALGEEYITESKAAELLNITLDELRARRIINEHTEPNR